MMEHASHRLRARRLGIDTHSESVVFLRKDCPVCRSEGFSSHNRVALAAEGHHAVATLYQVESDLLDRDEAGLSDAAWLSLGLHDGSHITVRHAPPVSSLSLVRGRVFGHLLDDAALREIIADIVAGRYSAIEISSFITACAAKPLSLDEICGLTGAMVDVGERLTWGKPIVADKHSVGGLPGNRTTPIIVAIVAALGLTMPKTSSRAITSPAGTADAMETMAPVALEEKKICDVVDKEGGCIAWGGALRLSPADDILIRVERALDIDSPGQMIASVLSKKIAAGATHLVIDMPVGPTAKVRDAETAAILSANLMFVAGRFGLHAQVVLGDGRQPIGRGIGPALEARDVLAVLNCDKDAPQDLRDRALILAGALLELCGHATTGNGKAQAAAVLDNGQAKTKFERICAAQGGMRTPPVSRYRKEFFASTDGAVSQIDNRRLARLAKLAGAPEDKAAGLELHVRLGGKVTRGGRLFTLHAEADGELAYASNYADMNTDIIQVTQT